MVQGVAVLLLAGATLFVARAEEPGSGGVAGELERTAGSSIAEKQKYATDALKEINQHGAYVQKLIEDATRRSAPDEERKCLAAVRGSLGALEGVVAKAVTSMNTNIDAGLTAKADFEFRKIAAGRSAGNTLRRDADACAATNQSGGSQSSTTTITDDGTSDGQDGDGLFPYDYELGIDAIDVSPSL